MSTSLQPVPNKQPLSVLKFPFIASLFILAGCTHLVTPPPVAEDSPSPTPDAVAPLPHPPIISHRIDDDGENILITIPHGAIVPGDEMNEIVTSARERIIYEDYFESVANDSLRRELAGHLHNVIIRDELNSHLLRAIISDTTAITISLSEDSSRLALLAEELLGKHAKTENSDPAPMAVSAPLRDDFAYLSPGTFLLPCAGFDVPKRPNLLPNAPRSYRNGIHRGIDFPAPYGNESRAVADGVVIRADQGYREITNEFRESLLEKAEAIKRTPSDIFEHVLLGRSVFLDHGLEIASGKRIISIYAHLAEIDVNLRTGESVKRGQLLGLVGNSGTSDGARGTKNGAHLHFEIIIQDENGERFLGQGLDHAELLDLVESVFSRK